MSLIVTLTPGDYLCFALWYKRLEKQKFKLPSNIDRNEFELTDEQFKWLLLGFDVLGHQELQYQFMI